MKKNIIIVGDYGRSDFLYIAKLLASTFNIKFLEYLDESEVPNDQHTNYGDAIFWKDYRSAIDLLDIVQPQGVIFYFIESYNQVALNVACKFKKIKTYHIEHGVRSFDLQRNNPNLNTTKAGNITKLKKIFKAGSRLKGRFFFQNTIKELPSEFGNFLKEYFKVRSNNNIFITFSMVKSNLRVADEYISFSPKIFEFHRKADHLPENYPVHYIGCPMFDYLYKFEHQVPSANDLLFIDQAFESQDLFGWTKEIKIGFLNSLLDVSVQAGRKLWIKSHPYTDEGVYEVGRNHENAILITGTDQFENALHHCTIVIGFYSTLLMPLIAFNHTTCFALEIHPDSGGFDNSAFFVATGAIKKITNWQQLLEGIRDEKELHELQSQYKQSFTEQWLYKFDGRSSERLKEIFISPSISC
jgi:hypothetical protein